MKKIIIVSDSHFEKDALNLILNYFPNMNAYLHCGDIVLEKNMYPMFQTVKGNHDTDQYPEYLLINIDGFIIYLVHGHTYMQNPINIKFWEQSSKDLDAFHQYILIIEKQMCSDAKKYNANMVAYGHTHLKSFHKIDNIYICNPGSTFFNGDATPPSFLYLEIDKDKIQHKFYQIDIKNNKIF